MSALLDLAAAGPVPRDLAHGLLASPRGALEAAARARRARARGDVTTYSPKVFLPLTNLCRNACGYCSFRRNPDEPGAWTMSPDEVRTFLEAGRATGCTEALFCLGDTPESFSTAYRELLRSFGHGSTVDYLVASGSLALDLGLLPHTNAGVLSRADLVRLRAVNASQGLMLESTADHLGLPGGAHYGAPDKAPAVRLAVHESAGVERIPFTSGLLVGIGEQEAERVDTLLAIADLHATYGHIQEVIVQRFTSRPGVRMAAWPEPDQEAVCRAVALARLILPDEVSVQAPPNLSARPGEHDGVAENRALLAAGIDDFGGISPLTPDFINPRHAWPHVDALGALCAEGGSTLRPRLPVHARFLDEPGWVADRVRAVAASCAGAPALEVG